MSTLHIVHCVDTEGPLNETIESTFKRLKDIFNINIACTKENLEKLQQKKIDLAGKEGAVAKLLDPKLLDYNNTWKKLNLMLDEIFSKISNSPTSFGYLIISEVIPTSLEFFSLFFT